MFLLDPCVLGGSCILVNLQDPIVPGGSKTPNETPLSLEDHSIPGGSWCLWYIPMSLMDTSVPNAPGELWCPW